MDTSKLLPGDRPPSVALSLAGYVGALLLVALSTLVGLLIATRWGSSDVVLLFLPAVLATAIYAGLRPGLLSALASTLAYNYYFTAPYRTFFIHSPADAVTVLILFLVAVVTSQLAASVRRQARLASAHASRNAMIAGFARRLLAATNEAQVCEETVRELSDLFACQAVMLTGPETHIVASAPHRPDLNPSDLAAAAVSLQSGAATGRRQPMARESDWQFYPITSQDRTLATIGLAREDGGLSVNDAQRQLLDSLLDQTALALERARLDREARDAMALRELDRLRSALLRSIGSDVKPSLNAIQANLRALRRDGSADRALLAEMTTEVTKMDRYIDNLVELGPGEDAAELQFADVRFDLHRRMVTKAGEAVHLTPKEFAVFAELAKHAGRVLTHHQLLRAVWGPAQQDQIDYLRVAIRALRLKLERDPARPEMIMNEPGVGYRLVPPPA